MESGAIPIPDDPALIGQTLVYIALSLKIISSYGHISQITLDPVRSPKLSCEEPP